jgi:hypothetical protein
MNVSNTTVRSPGAARRRGAAPIPLDYPRLLGHAAWLSLPPASRERFSTHRARYTGSMLLRSSPCGRVLACLGLLVGSPLPRVTGDSIPTRVDVAPDPMTDGSRWTRHYGIGRRSITVQTVKAVDRDGALVERLGGGLRMRLKTLVRERALHFVSDGYYLEFPGGLRLELPRWCPPGRTEVVHTDLGGGRFRFTMTIRHGLVGELFHHEGVFERLQGER